MKRAGIRVEADTGSFLSVIVALRAARGELGAVFASRAAGPAHGGEGPRDAASTNPSTPAFGPIARAGMDSPARHRRTASRFSAPATMKMASAVRLKRRALIVTRCGGGFGASNTGSMLGAS